MIPVVAVVAGVVACALVVIVVLLRRGGGGGGAGPRVPLQQCWQEAALALGELGMRAIDAECFNTGRLYLKLELASGGVWAWLDQSYGSGMIDAHPGASATLRAGASGHGELGRWLAAEVGPLLATLPRGAELSVKGPEIAGADCKLALRTRVHAPDHVAAAARVMLALDAAARRPAEAAAHAAVPKVVELWRAAAPTLEALGLQALDTECYTADRLFVRFDLGEKAVYAWCDANNANGELDAHPRQKLSLHPGKPAHSELAQWVAAQVGAAFAALPHRAYLDVTCPEIPGAEYKLRLESPLQTPDDAANVARAMLALAAACRQPVGAGAAPLAGLPPVVAHWTAAAAAFEALGLGRVDAELYTRGSLCVSLQVSSGAVYAWIDGTSGPALDGFCGQRATLHGGGRGAGGTGSELARHLAGLVQPALASLPPRAELDVTGPEIPGAAYKVSLTTPVSAPDHAVAAAQVMVSLEAALQRR